MSNPYINDNPYPFIVDPTAMIQGASNILTGTNPSYVAADFLAIFPQFTNTVASPILDMFINMANATVQEVRWHESWAYGMALFIAHFAELYVQSSAGVNATAQQVMTTAESRGLTTQITIGEVASNIDYSLIAEGLSGWAMWGSTIHGEQFATLAKIMGKGGMLIW